MCGICGLWYLDGRPVEAGEIKAMADALAHRGPDGEGFYIDCSLGLGHRRLAILDLGATGHQPMPYAEGRYWITYNGEVYNFLELRAELEGRGYTFTSTSDTEVILAAYDAWGPDCLLRFNGMWALAIWDRRERTLFLARDRFGIKPLFYLQEPGRLAFASEMKAFLPLPGFRPRVNLPVLKGELLEVHSQEWSENCLLEGVWRVRPGEYAMVGADGTVQRRRWWRTRDHLVEVPQELEEQAEQFRALFDESCRLRLRSDVPVGTCLSGGLDSSSVVCAVAEVARQGGARVPSDWQRAFVATFPGTHVDERRYAEVVIAQTGVRPVFQAIEPQQALEVTDQVVFHLEQIYGAPPWSLWLLYQRLRHEGVVVTLDGHGGDELLGGYDHYTICGLYEAGSWRHCSPWRYLELLRIYAGLHQGGPDTGVAGSTGELLWSTCAPLRALRRLMHHPTQASASTEGVDRWLSPEMRAIEPAMPTPGEPPMGNSLLDRTLYHDFHEGVMQTILRNYDRMSMAHGVEIRMPFMDWRLVTFAFSLPATSKIGRGYTKLILREALKSRLPEPIRTRRDKIGFATPLSDWMQAGGTRWLTDMVNEPGFAHHPLWDGAAIRDWVAGHRGNQNWTLASFSKVWGYVNAYLWLRRFGGEI